VHPDGLPDLTRPLEQALFERRMILVSGVVDNQVAGRVAASLLTLDALGDDPIEMRLNASSDSLDAAFALMDTIDALGVDVHATVAGSVTGTMVGVLAVCQVRRIGRLGGICLREPHFEYSGSARDLSSEASEARARLDSFVRRLSEATGRPLEHLEADLQTGRNLDAASSLAYGLVDVIAAN
jgi:ATP-dependent Clp protease protease subunit